MCCQIRIFQNSSVVSWVCFFESYKLLMFPGSLFFTLSFFLLVTLFLSSCHSTLAFNSRISVSRTLRFSLVYSAECCFKRRTNRTARYICYGDLNPQTIWGFYVRFSAFFLHMKHFIRPLLSWEQLLHLDNTVK